LIIGTMTVAGLGAMRRQVYDYTVHYLYIAVGMCATTDTAAETDTALVKELDRALATVAVSGDQLTVSISGVVDWSGDIMEVGIFNMGTGGTMLYRGLLSQDSTTPKSRFLNIGDTLSVSIVLDLANGAFV
jgi:hypothetical protein